MKMTLLATTAAALLLAGCASRGGPEPELSAKFDEAEARAMLKPGSGAISGSALIRQRGGGVVTCAGNLVGL